MPITQEANLHTVSGNNFTAVDAGDFAQLDNYKFEHPALKRTVSGKLFAKQFLGLTGMEISMNKFPPGAAIPFYHAHKSNEEVYIFVGGRGQMQVDGQTFDVREGTVVRVSPEGMRTIRNNSSADLFYICIQAKNGSLGNYTTEDGIRGDKPVSWPD